MGGTHFAVYGGPVFGLFLAGFGLFWANFAHWGELGAHLDVRRGALLTALPPPQQRARAGRARGDGKR